MRMIRYLVIVVTLLLTLQNLCGGIRPIGCFIGVRPNGTRIMIMLDGYEQLYSEQQESFRAGFAKQVEEEADQATKGWFVHKAGQHFTERMAYDEFDAAIKCVNKEDGDLFIKLSCNGFIRTEDPKDIATEKRYIEGLFGRFKYYYYSDCSYYKFYWDPNSIQSSLRTWYDIGQQMFPQASGKNEEEESTQDYGEWSADDAAAESLTQGGIRLAISDVVTPPELKGIAASFAEYENKRIRDKRIIIVGLAGFAALGVGALAVRFGVLDSVIPSIKNYMQPALSVSDVPRLTQE